MSARDHYTSRRMQGQLSYLLVRHGLFVPIKVLLDASAVQYSSLLYVHAAELLKHLYALPQSQLCALEQARRQPQTPRKSLARALSLKKKIANTDAWIALDLKGRTIGDP